MQSIGERNGKPLPYSFLENPMNSVKRQKDMTLKSVPQIGRCPYSTVEEWRNSSRENEEAEPKWKQCPVVNVTGDGSKVQCCKEQYCTGTWNVRSINQHTLEVVKQEMARVNIGILGISELKWTGMGEFNSDDHYIYFCRQESLIRNGVATMVNKRVWNAVLGCNLKNDRLISVCFQGKPPNITVIQVYATNSNAERGGNWMILWRPPTTFRTNTQKRCPFHYRGLECKIRKSRNTWSNRQIWPWNTEWGRTKARVVPRECTGHSKHPLPTTQEKTLHMDITRWSTPKPDWLYSLQPRWRRSIQSAKTRLGAECGSDHELLIAKFRLNWRK